MYIPVEIQREILSYAGYHFPKSKANKGRCLCYTKLNRRCKRRLNYSKRLFCNIHDDYNNFIKSIIKTKVIKYNKSINY